MYKGDSQEEVNKLTTYHNDRIEAVQKHISNIDSAIEYYYDAYDDDVFRIDTKLIEQFFVIAENYMALTDWERYNFLNDKDGSKYPVKDVFLQLSESWFSILDLESYHGIADFPTIGVEKVSDAFKQFYSDGNIDISELCYAEIIK